MQMTQQHRISSWRSLRDSVRNALTTDSGLPITKNHRPMYRLKEERVGQWSDIADISVMGG
jgi:hypothetical protein